ncbi:MAG: TonB family protein [bacterium]|nr:MAG: TonB family protein [bacterium]
MNRPLATLLACAVALPALAQDASADWDFANDQRRKLMVAYTQFNNGVGLATRCIDGGFEVVITGLPPAGDATSRTLRTAFGDGELEASHWIVGIDDTVAVSELPAPFARELREGGRLRIFVPEGAPDGRNLMYDLALPASSASIDQTLTTCNRPLIDPRDAELDALEEGGVPHNLTWAARPTPRFPNTNYACGFAVATCVTNPDGTLRDCAIEFEHPRDGRFGQATLDAARRARLQNVDQPGAPVPLTRVLYKTNYVVSGYQTPEDLARQRDSARREREERAARRAAAAAAPTKAD